MIKTAENHFDKMEPQKAPMNKILFCSPFNVFSINQSINQSMNQSVNHFICQEINTHWTGHQGRTQPPLTGAHKNKVSKSTK